MQKLVETLLDYDIEMLRIIANRWDISLAERDAKKAAEQLGAAMLNAQKTEAVWNKLTDEQRGALQTVLSARDKDDKPKFSMSMVFFTRMFGEIRSFGPEKLAREKPHLNPPNIAEALYFRGLIAKGFDRTAKGATPVMYIPGDLAALLPSHHTSYDNLEAVPAKEAPPPMPAPDNAKLADTSLVDDLTTLLAACRLEDIPLTAGAIPAEFRSGIRRFLLGTGSASHFALMTALALDLELLQVSDPGSVLRVNAQKARPWLEASRPMQLHALVKAWMESVRFNELNLIPSLRVERAANDPRLARRKLREALEMAGSGWFPLDEVVEGIKAEEPDFQRPGGDFNAWYIRDAEKNEYLRGFDGWDRIDGEVLRFILAGVMHGLCLTDITTDKAACHLTVYGRAWIENPEVWKFSQPETATIQVLPDGTCHAPRAASRYERSQLARFTEWISAGDPYMYRLTSQSVEAAKRQDLRVEQLIAFLKRATGDRLPESVVARLEAWDKAAQPVTEPSTLSQLIVLRTPAPDVLSRILSKPELRRFLGAQLGENAVVVRDEHWADLVEALRAEGIPVSVDGE